jgi:hypothetical protein
MRFSYPFSDTDRIERPGLASGAAPSIFRSSLVYQSHSTLYVAHARNRLARREISHDHLDTIVWRDFVIHVFDRRHGWRGSRRAHRASLEPAAFDRVYRTICAGLRTHRSEDEDLLQCLLRPRRRRDGYCRRPLRDGLRPCDAQMTASEGRCVVPSDAKASSDRSNPSVLGRSAMSFLGARPIISSRIGTHAGWEQAQLGD